MARKSKGNYFTSQSNQLCVFYNTLLLLLVCSDSFLEVLVYQGVHLMFKEKESRVSSEKATSVFKSGSFCIPVVALSSV